MKLYLKITGLLLVFGILIWIAMVVTDPDFGWHYRLGELIIKEGIVRVDPFTYTMPSYPFVDFEWGSNILIYAGETYLGRWLSAALWAALAMAAFIWVVPAAGKKYWWWTLGLGLTVAVTRFAIRPQVLSWVFTAIVVRLLADESLHQRWKWSFVAVMFFWANLHGSYFVGLGLWGVWWGVKMIRSRKFRGEELVIGILGTLATLINPYGIRDWQEVIMQTSQTGMYAATLEEWRPFWAKIDLGMAAMVAWLMGLGWRYRKDIYPEELVVTLLAFAAGLSSLRHGVLTMVIWAPLSVKLWLKLEEEISKIKASEPRWQVFKAGAGAIVGILLVLETGLLMKHQLRQSRWGYPIEAVNYLKTNGYQERMMANYGWGGYLIWKMPEHKVFIDGRMSGWWWEGRPGESSHAFREYMNTVTYPEIYAGATIKKYGINTVLWRKEQKTAQGFLAERLESLDKYKISTGRIFENWLIKEGWNKRYEDEVATIFASPDSMKDGKI